MGKLTEISAMEINGKIIWVTGASSGIGKALVQALTDKGAKVILSSRSAGSLSIVMSEFGLSEDQAFILPLDLEQTDTFSDRVAAAIAKWGRVDALVNNGGISQRSLVKDTPLQMDRKMMEVNYFGTVALSKALLPHFLSQKSGYFVVVTSLMGKFGAPWRSSYAGAKHALHGFFDSLRAELHDEGVKVTLVCPGFVQTNVSLNALTADGTPQNTMDEKTAQGISAENCAAQIVRAIEKESSEIYPAKKEKYALYLKRFFPGLFERVVRSAKVK
jgi:dehydrogenase/reductase SDR family member 7B